MSTAKSMWGDLSDLETVRTPKAILVEQAIFLTKATSNVLVGDVKDVSAPLTKEFVYDFNIVVPALNNYIYTVLRIEHEIDFYPLMLRCGDFDNGEICGNEQAFCGAVEAILSSTELKRIISRLVSQAS